MKKSLYIAWVNFRNVFFIRFAGLLGKILSEMAIDGKTNYDISPFTLDREALKDPNTKPVFFMGSDIEASQPVAKL